MRDAQPEAPFRQAQQVRVRIDEAREHIAAAQIDDRFADARRDVGAPTRERDTPVADNGGVDARQRRVQDVECGVGYGTTTVVPSPFAVIENTPPATLGM